MGMHTKEKKMKKLKKIAGGLLVALVALAMKASAQTQSAFASAVDFAQAGTDVNYVGAAVIVFSLGIIGFWIVYKLMHSAKRA